jgi:hypothetical protein
MRQAERGSEWVERGRTSERAGWGVNWNTPAGAETKSIDLVGAESCHLRQKDCAISRNIALVGRCPCFFLKFSSIQNQYTRPPGECLLQTQSH